MFFMFRKTSMKYYKITKRTLDVLTVILFSPFFIFIILFCSTILFIFQGGPIFYNSYRLGENLKVFKIYKFRTMKIGSIDLRNEDGSTFNSVKDSRVTKIGSFFRKLSLDELPQILNVLKGEMSFIGPRPDLPDQIDIYTKNNLSLDRFKVKPGITGYAQVNGRNSLSPINRNKLDIFYVNNISFLFDTKIFFITIFYVLFFKNVHKNDTK